MGKGQYEGVVGGVFAGDGLSVPGIGCAGYFRRGFPERKRMHGVLQSRACRLRGGEMHVPSALLWASLLKAVPEWGGMLSDRRQQPLPVQNRMGRGVLHDCAAG